jgi:aminoglycoside 6'-N-acetyltransferase
MWPAAPTRGRPSFAGDGTAVAAGGGGICGRKEQLLVDVEKGTAISLRPATPEDRFLIRRWLADPEVQTWWGNAASAEAGITLAMDSATALPRIILCGGTPIGYAHAVEIGVWAEERPAELPPGTWDVDLFIASAAHRGKGLGHAALGLLTEEVFATTLAVACSAVVSVRNEAAVRAYERAGFRWQRIWPDPLFGPCWLMLKERPPPAR